MKSFSFFRILLVRHCCFVMVLIFIGWIDPCMVRGEEAKEKFDRLNIPLISFQYWQTGRSILKNQYQPGDLTVAGHTYRISGVVGHRFRKTQTTLLASVRYDLTQGWAKENSGVWRYDSYHATFLRLTFIQELNNKWSFLTFGFGGIASDMEQITKNDMRLTFGVGAIYQPNPRLRLTMGAMYTTSLFISMPLPLLCLSYKTSNARIKILVAQKTGGLVSPESQF